MELFRARLLSLIFFHLFCFLFFSPLHIKYSPARHTTAELDYYVASSPDAFSANFFSVFPRTDRVKHLFPRRDETTSHLRRYVQVASDVSNGRSSGRNRHATVLRDAVTQPDGTNYSNSLCIRTGASLGNRH